MIAEDVLERGLAAAADDYDVPAGAVDRLREQIAPRTDEVDDRGHWPPRPSRRGWWAIGAGVAAAAVALPFAFGGSSMTDTAPAAGQASKVVPTPLASDRASGSDTVGGTTTGSGAGTSTGSGGGLSRRDQRLIDGPVAAPLIPDAQSPPDAQGQYDTYTPTNGGKASPGNPAYVPSLQERVIKTGVLDLQVPRGEVSDTLNRLTGLATLMRGYVANSRTSEGGFAPSGQVTLRIPVANFEEAISRARTYGSKVLALETSGQDVTNKYVDLAARIKALKATRATFLQLLAKATTIGETLAVQQHVTDVQTQIEQLQGQLRVLANHSSLSTLTVTVDQKVAATTAPHHQSGISKAFHRSVDRFVNGVEAIVGALGPILLALLLIGLAWLAARVGYRLLRRRMV